MINSRFSQFSLVLHEDAIADLEALWENDEDAAAEISAFLQEVKASQDMLDRLTCNKYVRYEKPEFSVEVWATQQNRKRNLWRLRLFALTGSSAKQRIVYAFHPLELRYYILGIVHREFDYDLKHPVSNRISKAYDAIDIPSY